MLSSSQDSIYRKKGVYFWSALLLLSPMTTMHKAQIVCFILCPKSNICKTHYKNTP